MERFGNFICKNKNVVIIISCVLLLLSVIGMNLTKVNYDILVYLPNDIETIKGQGVLVNDFNMGAYSITIIDNMSSKDILKLEDKIRDVEGVNKVVSLYDVVGTSIPLEVLPDEIVDKVHQGESDLLLITFDDSTSSENTINAVREIRNITDDSVNLGGMSSMVLDTMNLSEREIAIYILIAVILCMGVLELSLDSYFVPVLLLANIGCAILFNLGTNIFLGQISYITKALVAVLQLGVTMDFSIFLYHSYEKKKGVYKSKEEAMKDAIKETFVSVTGSSLTTIVGFLALCAMQLTLGKDLGIVMAKGVLLGVVMVLTLFPSLLLVFDKLIEKTKHRVIIPNFSKLNKFIVKNHIVIFVVFVLLFIPAYLANSNVSVYYKLDSSLPDTLESIKTNNLLKEQYNIVSPEIILINKDLKNSFVTDMINEIKDIDGIDMVLSFNDIKNMGITENMLSSDVVDIFENDKYQMILINSVYDIATSELNNQVDIVNNVVKKYDSGAIVAGEGPLMKDLVQISDIDFNNVNSYSIICIFVVLFFVLKSISLPILLILVIEFAIFTNMSISYFGDVVLPFIAPIVLGTIQLGATIDYAILMTTNYLERRRKGMEKQEAMLETMNYCGSSVLTSGMCFFAATFGVGLYSEIEMIGSLCSLISRGALISMFVVIIVLPAVLLIFDKIILKTTLGSKEGNKMKTVKKLSKNVAVWLLIGGIVISSSPVYALTKNEIVYSKLNTDGSVKEVLVNEQLLNTSNADSLEDYSELKDILNINDDNTYELSDNNLVWNASGKDVFYQGTISKNLPISVEVSYMLDNKEMSLDDIIGKSGNVTIKLRYKNNDRHGSLYTPFVVTTGMIVNSDNNSNISVVNGKVINNGTKNIVVGMSAPGLYESLWLDELKGLDTISINYDTTCFELDNIYSVATPKLLDSSDLKIFDKLNEIYGNVNELQENMDLLDEGALKLSTGSGTLKSELEKSIMGLSNVTGDVLTQEQLNGIKDKAIFNIQNTYSDLYKEQIANSAWKEVKNSLSSSEDDTIINFVKSSVNDAVVEYLNSVSEYVDYVNCETGKVVMEQTGSMSEEQMASCMVIQNDKTLPFVVKAATTSSSKSASESAYYIAEVVSKSVSVSVSEKTALEVGSNVSLSVSNEVANQVRDASLSTIINSLNTLYNGIDKLDSGINELSTGITKFNNDGINKIYTLVNNNVKSTTDKIKMLTELGNNYASFSGKRSSDDGSVKFVFSIASKSVENKTVNNEKATTKLSFWEKLKNLFN